MAKVRLSSLVLTLIIFQFSKGIGQAVSPQIVKPGSQQELLALRQQFWDSLPRPTGWVNDYEGLYSKEEKLKLDSIIGAFKKETGTEIAIVTIDSMFIARDYFDALTLHIADEWGVGEKGKDNGILIAISRGHRKIRINNGKGIEKLITDAETLKIVNSYFIPYLKKGEYYSGTLTGLKELIKLIKRK
jgi:uncharacterized protein